MILKNLKQQWVDIIHKQKSRKKKVSDLRKKEAKRARDLYILMTPYFLLFFLFTVIPVSISIIFSFTYFNML
jgi:multiple sugar transport system permease protein